MKTSRSIDATRCALSLSLLTSVFVSACGGGGGSSDPMLVIVATSTRTTEPGEQATLTVALAAAPASAVTVPVVSNDASEGVASPATVTFTPENWNAPQTVLVTGVDDTEKDGNQTYHVTFGPTQSDTKAFDDQTASSPNLTNVDDESAGFIVSAAMGPTNESGATTTFTVRLTAQPTANVTLNVASSDTSEGTISSPQLVFTSLNWSAPQTVVVTGVDDDIADGAQAYTITFPSTSSADAAYANAPLPAAVALSNVDDDSPGFTITHDVSTTSEAGGTVTLAVALSSQPSANVTIGVSSSATDEGTVSPTSVTFTSSNWNAPQFVTVTGQNDDAEDGSQVYAIIFTAPTSTDVGYSSLPAPASVSLTNKDNDTPGVSIVPGPSSTTSESGGSASFGIVLDAPPAANVTVTISSSDTTEGEPSPTTVTFTPGNWNAPQSITVTGKNDDIADGSQSYMINFAAPSSTDPRYTGLGAPASLSFSNTDNDTPGITVNASASLVTTEGSGTATFTVVLNTKPTADVTVNYASNATDEGIATPLNLVFTTDNWGAPQTVTVTGQNDDVADGAQPYRVNFTAISSSDPGYNALVPAAFVALTNTDNDSAGITIVAGPSSTTTEGSGTATFSVRLNSQPTANVTVSYASNATDEGIASPAGLLFTTDNWNALQEVTVTGQDDDVADGNQIYAVVFSALSSTDPGYSGFAAPASRTFTNTDNDSPGFLFAAGPGTTTTEAGGTATFTVKLTSQPLADVTLAFASNATDEGIASPDMLVFTTGTWNVAQTVTVTGRNDDVADGNQPFSVVFSAPTSADTGYGALSAPASRLFTNTDNDSPGISVARIGTKTTEIGGTAQLTVVLGSEPTANVTVSFATNAPSEGTVAPTSFVFTPGNWNVPRTATVTGADDALADGNQSYNIVFSTPSSSDTGYSTLPAPAALTFSNVDNDVTAPTISAPTLVRLANSSQTTVSFGGYLNGESFQQDAILTFNGYQYAAYWNVGPRVILARRPLSGGAWAKIELDPEYVGMSGDAHNTISLGISPSDGRLHVVFDHHTSNLHYNFSVAGLVTNPETAVWATSSFQATYTSMLGSTFVAAVTYPRFITTPSGKLLLEFRNGTSGNGDEEMWEYDGATSTWSPVGVYISGFAESINPYIHGIEYNGTRLHAAWCWRSSPDATTNFGLAYAYSDDDGRTWMNSAGQQIGVANSVLMNVNSPGLHVWPIPQNRGYINQEYMTVDNAGRVHVLISHMPDAQADDSNFTNARTKSRFFHYWRDTDGMWRRNATNIPVNLNFRGKLAVSASNNLYAVLPNLRIASASASTDWTNWTVVNTTYAGQYFSDPLIDRSLLRLGNTLSIFTPTVNTGGTVFIDSIYFTLP